MKALLLIAGWTLRASAAICIVWTTGQVIGGQIATLPALLSSIAFHGAFALAGTGLCGQAKRMTDAAAALRPVEE